MCVCVCVLLAVLVHYTLILHLYGNNTYTTILDISNTDISKCSLISKDIVQTHYLYWYVQVNFFDQVIYFHISVVWDGTLTFRYI